MNLLIIGNGGREHAIGLSLSGDPRVTRLFFAPGNAGTATLGENVPIAATDLDALTDWAQRHRPDLTVVGPEAPLCLGLVDRMMKMGLEVFGPNQLAAQLEGSKVFAKSMFEQAGIPTAIGRAFDNADAAREFVATAELPLVVKADGLASGKGVLICQTREQASDAIDQIMTERRFGAAGNRVLVEEFLEGEEASIHALTDGHDLVVLPPSQDHKRIFDGDQGPNTGGMGAYAPAPVVTGPRLEQIIHDVFRPLLDTLRQNDITYRGVLYGGLMLTASGPKVLEFNCRFGDPETQVLLPLLETPLLDLLLACVRGTLRQTGLRVRQQSALTVVMAAPGYPDAPRTGGVIQGLDAVVTSGVSICHAGTTTSPDGSVRTSGGRVLAVTATADDLPAARDLAYQAVEGISFEGAQFRRDIGHRALSI